MDKSLRPQPYSYGPREVPLPRRTFVKGFKMKYPANRKYPTEKPVPIREGIIVKNRICLKCGEEFKSDDGSRICAECHQRNKGVYVPTRFHEATVQSTQQPRGE